jgi:tetratricopeptide (TPR) repeat protein
MSSTRLEKLLNFLADSPQDAFLLFALAKEYESLNQPDQAMERYQELLRVDPSYVGLYYHLAKLYEKKEAYQEAWDAYTQGMAVAKNAGDQHALSELVGARLQLGDEDDFE